jgi:hypothetical protein
MRFPTALLAFSLALPGLAHASFIGDEVLTQFNDAGSSSSSGRVDVEVGRGGER